MHFTGIYTGLNLHWNKPHSETLALHTDTKFLTGFGRTVPTFWKATVAGGSLVKHNL